MSRALHQEYIERHKLAVPVVLYNARSTAFIRSKNEPYTWRVLVLAWRDVSRHPGFFEVSYNEAIHDGFNNSSGLIREIGHVNCYWDVYEDYILRLAESIRASGFIAPPIAEQTLAAWGFFLYMFDSWLAATMDSNFFWLVEYTLRQDVSLNARLKAFHVAKKQLAAIPEISKLLLYQILPLARSSSDWLVNLING